MYRYFVFFQLMMQMPMLKEIYLTKINHLELRCREELLTGRVVDGGGSGGGGGGGGNGIAEKKMNDSK